MMIEWKECTTAQDVAYVLAKTPQNIKAATPVLPDDVATKEYVDEIHGDVMHVDTIERLADVPHWQTVIVRDQLRGGTFVYDPARAGENDGGIVFDGWVRMVDGDIDVSWFGSDSTGTIENTIAKTKMLCKFDMEQVAGEGNLQGATLHNGVLYAVKNIKNNDGGVPSYSPGETGKVIKFAFNDDGSELTKIGEIDIDKFGHQTLSGFVKLGKFYLVNSGGTPDSDAGIDIQEYSGKTATNVYANAGKSIAVHNVDDGTTEYIQLMPEYNPNVYSTRWFHSVPYASPDGKRLVVAFSDIYQKSIKLFRVYDLAKLMDGTHDQNDYLSEFSVPLSYTQPVSTFVLQGLLIYRDEIMTQWGYYHTTYNKLVLIHDMAGNVKSRHEFFPTGLEGESFTRVELEGMLIVNGLPAHAVNTKSTDGSYMAYIYAACTGVETRIAKTPQPPAPLYGSGSVDIAIDAGEAMSVISYSTNGDTKMLHRLSSGGSPAYSGTFLALYGTASNPYQNQPLKYLDPSGGRQVLEIRGWGTNKTDGAGINLYGANDASNPTRDIYFFCEDFKIKNPDTDEDVFKVSAGGNILANDFIALDYDGASYQKIVKFNADRTVLGIRSSNGSVSDGSAISMMSKDHATYPYTTVVYCHGSDGGHFILSDIEESDPGIAGAVWNDNGTLKISAG